MVNHQSDGSSATPDHIDQIREILLGPQKRQFDSTLEQLRKELDATRKELATLRKTVEQNQESSHRELTAGLQRMQEADGAMRQEVLRQIASTEADLRSQQETLSAELQSRFDALRADKVSADALAEHLQELAMKLKGVHVLQELKKAAGRRSGE